MSSSLPWDDSLAWALATSREGDESVPERGAAIRERRIDALTGDEFDRIYDEYARALWGYLCRMTRSAPAADDLLQETFCRFLEAPASPADARSLKAYLFRIASNLAIDHARRRRREAPASDSREGAEFGSDSASLRMDIEPLFARLKPRERSLLWLAHVEEMTHAEIAAATGLARASVRVLLFRARRRFQGLLEDAGFSSGASR